MVGMKRQWWAAAAAAWVGVVAVVALLVWWVIQGAGDDVLAEPAADVFTVTPTDRSASPTDRTDPTASTTSTDAPPAPVRRTSTWQGEAGFLRVSCTGSALRLEGATPAAGWVVDSNEKKSGRELEVRFESADGDRRVEVTSICVDGVPDLAVELDD